MRQKLSAWNHYVILFSLNLFYLVFMLELLQYQSLQYKYEYQYPLLSVPKGDPVPVPVSHTRYSTSSSYRFQSVPGKIRLDR